MAELAAAAVDVCGRLLDAAVSQEVLAAGYERHGSCDCG